MTPEILEKLEGLDRCTLIEKLSVSIQPAHADMTVELHCEGEGGDEVVKLYAHDLGAMSA